MTGPIRLTLSLLAVALVLAPSFSRAAEPAAPSPEHQKALTLVQQLGDSSYKAREEASDKLLKLGLAAKQALQEGANDSDPEIRRRCLELLPAVLDADLKARVDAFLADKDGKKSHDLPGWPRFQKMVGSDQPARELFADMLKTDVRLLEDVETYPDQAGELFAGRCQLMQQAMYGRPGIGGGTPTQLKLPEVASVLFVGSDPKVKTEIQSVYIVCNFLYQPVVRNALDASKPSPFRKLLVGWMKQQDDPNVLTQLLYVTQNLNLKEGLEIAVKVIKDKTANAHTMATALMVVGKVGGKENVSLLEPLFTDNKLLTNFQIGTKRVTTEVRDVALAMAVHLTGQSHKDYAFPFTDQPGQTVFNYYALGFATEEERAAAQKKWKEWAAAKKK